MDTATILAEINKLAAEIQQSQGVQTADLMATEERRGYANETRQRENTTHVLDRIKSYGDDAMGAIERRGSENINTTVRASSDIRTLQEQIAARQAVTSERGVNELVHYAGEQGIRSSAHHGDTVYKIKELHADIGDYFKQTQVEILGVGTSIERQSAAQFAATQNGLLKVENSLGRQGDYNFSKLQNQAAVNYNQIQVQALQISNDLSKQMAKCCCEIKERVDASESSIKQLINNNEAADLRLRISNAETQNLLRRR
jgi:ribosomal protein L7/L12